MMRTLIAITLTLLFLMIPVTGHSRDIRIGVVLKALNSEFWLSVKRGAESAAQEQNGVTLLILAPDSEVHVQQQIQIVEDILMQSIDVLIITPCGGEELTPALHQVHAAGVPVIVADTEAPFPELATFVGTNNILGGEIAADYIINTLHGNGKVAIISGIMGHKTSMDRVLGAQNRLKNHPGIEVVAVQSANWERAQAMSVMENILSSYPDLDAVFCCNDAMALGALEAVSAEKAKTLVIGFDASSEAVKSVNTAGMAATVAQNAENIGKYAVEAAIKVSRGEKIPTRIDTGTELVTSDNAANFLQ